MSAHSGDSPFEPFFLPAAHGERFCIFHLPVGAARGGIVYLHPFAEEMNKSRRMAALQSRMLAARGFAVLQIDLFGCGDSSGDFGDARWEIWRQDVALAVVAQTTRIGTDPLVGVATRRAVGAGLCRSLRRGPRTVSCCGSR